MFSKVKKYKRLILIVIAFPIQIYCTSFFIDVNHADAKYLNPGSIDHPWQSIQHAVQRAQAGDTVFIRAGTYHEWINLGLGHSGNEKEGYIVYTAYNNEPVILEGINQDAYASGFFSGDAWASVDYVVIQNMEIRNYGGGGIIFDRKRDATAKGSHHIVLDNLIVHHNDGSGIYIWEGGIADSLSTHHIVIRNCVSFANRNHGIKLNGDDAGVITRGHIHDSIIENCTVYQNEYIGIHVSTGNYNITLRNNCCYQNRWEGIAAHEIWDSVYENNIVYNNARNLRFPEMSVAKSRNLVIRGNKIFSDQSDCFIGIHVNEGLDGSPETNHTLMNNCIYTKKNFEFGIRRCTGLLIENAVNNLISNNTFVLNPGYSLRIKSEGNIIKNNLFYNNWLDSKIATGNDISHNLFYLDRAIGDFIIQTDPLFVDLNNFDYRLQPESPAIDAGVDLGFPYFGEAPDIGAMESNYHNNSGIKDSDLFLPNSKAFRLFDNYPNPFNQSTTIAYKIFKQSTVILSLCDICGRLVRILLCGLQDPGNYSIELDAKDLASGIYFYYLRSAREVDCKRCILIK